jgi:hypothetical protein
MLYLNQRNHLIIEIMYVYNSEEQLCNIKSSITDCKAYKLINKSWCFKHLDFFRMNKDEINNVNHISPSEKYMVSSQ